MSNSWLSPRHHQGIGYLNIWDTTQSISKDHTTFPHFYLPVKLQPVRSSNANQRHSSLAALKKFMNIPCKLFCVHWYLHSRNGSCYKTYRLIAWFPGYNNQVVDKTNATHVKCSRTLFIVVTEEFVQRQKEQGSFFQNGGDFTAQKAQFLFFVCGDINSHLSVEDLFTMHFTDGQVGVGQLRNFNKCSQWNSFPTMKNDRQNLQGQI